MARHRFFLGTYTSADGSKGIYRSELDDATGSLATPILAAEIPSPSYLAISPNAKNLYAVREGSPGDVTAYAIAEDGGLKELNTVGGAGGGPCHIAVDALGHVVLTSAYGGGQVTCFPIRDGGALAPASSSFKNEGKGPNANRQEAPHMHAATATADARMAYACDLGTDEVLAFQLDAATGHLSLAEPRSVRPEAGGGPRHLVLSAAGDRLFVNLELTNKAVALTRDVETGRLTVQNMASTLPPGETRPNSTAAIALHPSQRWLMVSNRGHDSVAAFPVREGGIADARVFPTGVREPRGMALDPTGRWLVVAGQNSHDLRALPFDPAAGTLGEPGPTVALRTPVCVVFG